MVVASDRRGARPEYERTWALIGSRTIEELIDLPLMTDPVALATLDVLAKLQPPALYGAAGDRMCWRSVAWSISAWNTATLARLFRLRSVGNDVSGAFRRLPGRFRFGRLGCELLWATPQLLRNGGSSFLWRAQSCGSWDPVVPEKNDPHIQALTTHHEKLLEWPKSRPENFADRATWSARRSPASKAGSWMPSACTKRNPLRAGERFRSQRSAR